MANQVRSIESLSYFFFTIISVIILFQKAARKINQVCVVRLIPRIRMDSPFKNTGHSLYILKIAEEWNALERSEFYSVIVDLGSTLSRSDP